MKVRLPTWLLSVAYVLALASIMTGWAIHVRAQGAAKLAASERGESKGPSTARTLRLPDPQYRYAEINLPVHFKRDAAQRFDNTPSDNPLTDQGAALGRVLFYDTRLSGNNTIACGSCHVQTHAFADPNRFSRGFK